MATTRTSRQSPEANARRMKAGAWIRSQREIAELSQSALAKKVDQEYYTFISQVERGKSRIPPEDIQK